MGGVDVTTDGANLFLLTKVAELRAEMETAAGDEQPTLWLRHFVKGAHDASHKGFLKKYGLDGVFDLDDWFEENPPLERRFMIPEAPGFAVVQTRRINRYDAPEPEPSPLPKPVPGAVHGTDYSLVYVGQEATSTDLSQAVLA